MEMEMATSYYQTHSPYKGIVKVNMPALYLFTWGHVLSSPELENCPIKDRDYYEHVPSGQICKDSYGVPGWALEFHAVLNVSIEVCQVVP